MQGSTPYGNTGIPSEAAQFFGEAEAAKETAAPQKTESTEKSPSIKKEELVTLSKRVGLTALGLLASPAILAVGGVLALSKLLTSKDKASLWDKAVSRLILPAASRKNFESKPEPSTRTHHFTLNGTPNKANEPTRLSGMVHLARNITQELDMPPELAIKMPTVVLFCGNNASMEGSKIQKTADEYREKGFNVVVFNYRGVNDSQGRVLSAEDLEEDGKTVVREL